MTADRLEGLAVLGWREWVRLPDLGEFRTKAKLDSGARTSCLHAFDLVRFEKDGEEWVQFEIHPLQRRAEPAVVVTAPVYDERRIRSSNGKVEQRPVIRTNLLVGGVHWPIEITLTRRDEMGYRMLLGREALRGRALIDTGRSYLSGRVPRKKKKKLKTRTRFGPGPERRRKKGSER